MSKRAEGRNDLVLPDRKVGFMDWSVPIVNSAGPPVGEEGAEQEDEAEREAGAPSQRTS